MSQAQEFIAQAGRKLAELDTLLAQATSRCEVAWRLCEFAGRELALADAVVYLLDPGGDTLTQLAAWGPKRASDRVLESRITLALGQGIVGQCARLRLPQRSDDTRQDGRYVADDQVNLSELAVPVVLGATLYGVLDSEHPEPDYYSFEHEHALYAIAERGAMRLQALAAPR